ASGIQKVVVDPVSDSNVYVAFYWGGKTGIYKSTDSGTSWISTTSTLSTADPYTDLVLDANTPSTLYLAVGGAAGGAANGVYVSTNAGGSWNRLSGVPSGKVDGRITLALSADSSTLYISIAGSGQ